ncbi:MAG: hypothetical protein KC583_10545 [Myxococcales bacterium]|nr:hypothetical protein [Myxococcales bacterium]
MGVLEVVREVEAEALRDWDGRKLLGLGQPASPWVAVRDIPATSPAALMLYHYQRAGASSATKNLGEDASIAFCAHEAPDAVFVALDNNATYTAVSELGRGRVATPFDVWHGLRERGLLDATMYGRLCDATLRQRQNLPGVPRRLMS